MLSKAVGKKFGVAKLATPVVVKVPFSSSWAVYLDGVRKAYDHHRLKHDADKTARAIVSMSWVYPRADLSQEFINSLAQVIKLFVQIGGNPISGAGNNGQTPQHPQGGAVRSQPSFLFLLLCTLTNLFYFLARGWISSPVCQPCGPTPHP